MNLTDYLEKGRGIPHGTMKRLLFGVLGLVIISCFFLSTSETLEEKEGVRKGLIWPVADRVSVNLNSAAIPKSESVAACMKHYGADDWKTWRAQYFERRLKLKDDPFRSEHSSFEDVKRRGAVFNIWTGAEGQLYGMPPDIFRCICWPGVGIERIGNQSGGGDENLKAALHHHGPMTDEILTMFRGSGEGYIADHWIPIAESGDFIFAPAFVLHGLRSAGFSGAERVPSTKDWLGTGFACPAQWELYSKFGYLVIDESPEAKARGWKSVYKFIGWEDGGYGLLGSPPYLSSTKGNARVGE